MRHDRILGILNTTADVGNVGGVAELFLGKVVGAVDGLVVVGAGGSAEAAAVDEVAVITVLVSAAVIPSIAEGIGDGFIHFMTEDARHDVRVGVTVGGLQARAALILGATSEECR